MRTNIVLDDELVAEAFRYVPVSSKRELVALALKELIENRKRKDLRLLQNKVQIREDYDYKSLRK
jgi:Arc/MetJ family transcription regulator